MMSESRKPRKNDAVLGGNNPPPVNGLVLGGIEGVKYRLSSNSEEVRMAAIADTINYRKAGEELLFEILETSLNEIVGEVFNFLWKTIEPNRRKELKKYLPKLLKFNVKQWNLWRTRNIRLKLKIKLRYEDFSNANLTSAFLRDVDLYGSDLSHCNLSNANLSYANLAYANLSNANLSKANLSCAKLISAKAIEADFSNANFSEANLSHANFINANLTNSKIYSIKNTNTDGANLTGTKFDPNNRNDYYYESRWE